MNLPKHIRLLGVEKIAAGLGGASFGMPGMTPNETKSMPEIQALKPMGKNSPNVTGAPNPAVGQQQNLIQANMPKVPDLAANHFQPKLAGSIPLGSIVGDVGSEILEQLWLRNKLKKDPGAGMIRSKMRSENEPTVQTPGYKLGSALASGGNIADADNADRVPFGPYRPQSSFNAAGGGDNVQGPGNGYSDLVNANFGAVAKRLDTWQNPESSNASGSTMQEGSAYNEPIKSASKIVRSTEGRGIDGDDHAVEHGIRSQKATYDMTETRGGIGDSPFEGSPRVHDSLVGWAAGRCERWS